MIFQAPKKWFYNLPISRKGFILMLIPVVFQLVSVVVFFDVYSRLQKVRYQSNRSGKIILAIDNLRTNMNAAYYNGVLAIFVSSGEVKSDGRGMIKACRTQFSAIDHLAADNPIQVDRLRALKQDFERFAKLIEEFEQVSQLLAPSASTAAESSNKAEVIRSLFTESLRTKERFDTLLGAFRTLELQLQSRRERAVDITLDRSSVIVLGGYLSLILISYFVYTLFRDSIADRVKVVAGNINHIKEGVALTPAVTGRDEIAQLDTAIHSLSSALTEKDVETEMFLYSVSHDLRSPLVNLAGFADELRFSAEELQKEINIDQPSPENLRRARALLSEDFERSFGFIRNSVSRLSRIIDALLGLSRAGRVQYKSEPIALGPLLEQIRQSVDGTIKEKGATVNIAELPTVFGDNAALEQIFANLLSNALSYLDPSRPGVIEVGVIRPSTNRGTETIFVKDNGLGISETAQRKLFLAFQRFHPKLASGEGIGLALVRMVVSKIGGQITCHSIEGEGSTFFVTLPTVAFQRIDQMVVDRES